MPPERFNDAATSPQPPVPTLNKGAAEEPLQDGYESDTASIGSSLNDPPEIVVQGPEQSPLMHRNAPPEPSPPAGLEPASPNVAEVEPSVPPAVPETPASRTEAEEARPRTGSEAKAEAQIVTLEEQLEAMKRAKKYNECSELKKQIETMRNAQREISSLKLQLEVQESNEDFEACGETQMQIENLKLVFPQQVILPPSSITAN